MSDETDSGQTDRDEGVDGSPDEAPAVTVFLRHDAEVLLLRRGDRVGSHEGKWDAVSGFAEGDPGAAAREAIREETGLDPDDASLVRRGEAFDVIDERRGTRWVVRPFLFDATSRGVDTDYEAVEHEWAAPTETRRRETVPGLWTAYDSVRPRPEMIAADSDHGSAYLSVRALEVLRDEAAVAGAGDGAWSGLESLARELISARPSMAVVANRVDRAMAAAAEAATPESLESAARDGARRALAADAEAAALAAGRLPDQVATLSRSGTVAAALERADPEFVLVAASRPGGEGVWTAEHLTERTDAAVTLTTDAAFAERLVETSVDAVVVGADTVLPDGRVVNKVGTRAAATVARCEGVDCEVVAASDKIRAAGAADSGDAEDRTAVDREERDANEVYDGAADVDVANPTFDVTPPDRVDAVVTERGALDAASVGDVAAEHRSLAGWRS